jgi:hypothetical protein
MIYFFRNLKLSPNSLMICTPTFLGVRLSPNSLMSCILTFSEVWNSNLTPWWFALQLFGLYSNFFRSSPPNSLMICTQTFPQVWKSATHSPDDFELDLFGSSIGASRAKPTKNWNFVEILGKFDPTKPTSPKFIQACSFEKNWLSKFV